MTVRLIDRGWAKELADASRADAGDFRMICPFIKMGALNWSVGLRPETLRVITRFNLADFANGVSDIAALRKLLVRGAQIKGVKNLHAKLYVFGGSRAILTSANMTDAALNRNHEFGMVADEREVIRACQAYFDQLWPKAGRSLTEIQLARWESIVTRHLTRGGGRRAQDDLADFGAHVGYPAAPSPALSLPVAVATQAFVKFLGDTDNRVPLDFEVVDELKAAGCHWAVAYPREKRPRSAAEGATIFIARLTRGPNDMRVFGRATGMKYIEGRDDATPADIKARPWKKTWPHYIRVHDAEFVSGSMADGISVEELMTSLGSQAFLPTQRNLARGQGNTNPRKAYRQQAAVELTREAADWMNRRLEDAFERHGKVPGETLDALDWPRLPRGFRAES
jgi:hypothetical protein